MYFVHYLSAIKKKKKKKRVLVVFNYRVSMTQTYKSPLLFVLVPFELAEEMTSFVKREPLDVHVVNEREVTYVYFSAPAIFCWIT